MFWLYLPSPYHEDDGGAKKRSRRKWKASAELATCPYQKVYPSEIQCIEARQPIVFQA